MSAGSHPRVIVVGPVPPPLQGAAATTEAFAARLTALGPVRLCNNAVGAGGGIIGAAVKFARTICALGTVLALAGQPGRALYIALDGGLGLAYNLAVVALARVFGYRLYLHHHSFAYITQASLLMAAIARIAGRDATHVVLCGSMGAALAGRYPAAARAFVLSNAGLMSAPALPARAPGAHSFTIGFLSNLMPEKGVDTAVAVLREGLRRGLDLRLVLAGPVQDRTVADMLAAAKAELGPALDLTGAIGEAEKSAFFAGLDLFIFPSRYANEAEPRVVAEALLHGVPVIATARGCLAEMVGADAGAIVATGEDFTTAALALAEGWVARPADAARARAAALAQGTALAERGRAQLSSLARRIQGETEN